MATARGTKQTIFWQTTLFLYPPPLVHFALEVEGVYHSEMFKTIYQTARRHIPKDHKLIYKHFLKDQDHTIQISNTDFLQFEVLYKVTKRD